MNEGRARGFDDFVQTAAGFRPYTYQRRLAEEGLPELLEVPTGAGKTLAAVLPWLYRRRFHPDRSVKAATPRRLVVVLPMRVLVEQTVDQIRGWFDRLANDQARRFDVSDVRTRAVMGGDRREDDDWRLHPDADTILVGTLDMLLSRALNRGYAQSRWVWPVDFGLLNSDCHWVFDEIQLMGPALPTSRQFQAFRTSFGTVGPCSSTWMSATVDLDALATVDSPDIGPVGRVDPEDAEGPLRERLHAPKRVEELHLTGTPAQFPRSLAAELAARHQPGTLTIAMLNTVRRAQDVHAALLKRSPDAAVFLIHSRFRPGDRRRRLDEAITAPVDRAGPGRIVVATQVLEAGVDVSATTLFTEAAAWPSVVQRAGRCNRYGEASDAVLLWAPPPKPEPYDREDVAETAAALRRLEGTEVTPASLQAAKVPQQRVDHAVLRRRDLLELFDTAPDLGGDDLDVGRFLRNADDLDVQVAWRREPRTEGTPPPPTRDELCAVPLTQLRDWLQKHPRRAWKMDHIEDRWVPVIDTRELRPGHVVIVDAAAGGYLPERGWDPASRSPVEPVEDDEPSPLAASDEPVPDDPITYITKRWLPLVEHLEDVEREVRTLAALLALRPGDNARAVQDGPDDSGLSAAYIEAAAVAGRLHDLGKAHPVFQDTLKRSADSEQESPPIPGPWAKSGGSKRPRHARRYFRHELVSALALLGPGEPLLSEVADPDLVRYLVAAHHGRVRLAIRSLPDEDPHPDGPDARVALGVHDGDSLPAIEVPGGVIPTGTLDLSVMEMGAGKDGAASWTARALALRDRPDLGPFRLGMLEALVRLADWRASRAADQTEAP